jgi:transcriptional regulator with AAA-type ATPase domain/transcriptional regulatory protein LevR
MKRIAKIEKILREQNNSRGISALEVAEKLGLSRANVSSDLNQLVAKGIAVKSGTKPVYYFIPESHQLYDFDRFLRENGSLFQCGKLAKAAVLYPPHGMHIMLFGETGAGKSLFAKLIFEYAVARKHIGKDAAFVVFNCADYANNPQLLMSQLFGVSKGAYTGADSDRPGFLEQTGGGILFLDEVHRLPPEGQEMLFSYIDHGCYRRLGETGNTRSATAMLICATTENPMSSLLQTFTRRIPTQIKMPNLEERSLEERLSLISTFFNAESERIRNPVLVSVNTLKALMGYRCPGNVGQLKSDIQILCAKAYSDFVCRTKKSIRISSYDLPPNIRNGIFTEKNRRKIWNLLAGINGRFVTFDWTLSFDLGSLKYRSFPETDRESIYDLIERKTGEMRRIGANQYQVDEALGDIMTNYRNGYDAEVTGIEEIVGAEIVATVDKILETAEYELGRNFSSNVRHGLALHLNNAVKRILQGLPIVNPRFEYIKSTWPEIFKTAMKMTILIEEDFNIRLPPDEAAFIVLFLVPETELVVKHPPIKIIVIAHGCGIATGLAETANRLLKASIIKGFDVLLDEHQGETYRHIRKYLQQMEEPGNVLFLVDMGSLVNYSLDLGQELGISTRCISLVSTLHVLEAGRKALIGCSLEEVYDSTQKLATRISSEYHNLLSEEPAQRLFLLTVCTTGKGSAEILKEHLAKRLNTHNGLCTIAAVSITDPNDFNQYLEQLSARGRIIITVSALNIRTPGIRFKLTMAMTPAGIKEIQQIIDTEVLFVQISQNMTNQLSLSEGIISEIRNMMDRISTGLGAEKDDDVLIGLFCHIGCMIQRIKAGVKTAVFPEKHLIQKKYSRELEFIRRECNALSHYCAVTIPTDEAYFILIILKKEIPPQCEFC